MRERERVREKDENKKAGSKEREIRPTENLNLKKFKRKSVMQIQFMLYLIQL